MQFNHTPQHHRESSRRNNSYARARRRRARERRNASSDWGDEHVDQAVPVPNGGPDVLPSLGATVRDRDDADGGEVLVVRVHPESRADTWHIPALDGDTVAEVNPDFPPWSPVVEGVYWEELAATLDGWRSVEDVRDAVSLGALRSYSFPAARLAPVDRPDEERRVSGNGGERA